MKNRLITLLLVGALLCGCTGILQKSSDLASLQGVWLAQSESQNDRKWNVTYQYVFRGDRVSFKDETGKEMRYSFELDAVGSLKLITIRPEGAVNNSEPVSVAYELNGDSLKIVVAPHGLRPIDISDKNDQELIICRRKSP